MLLAVGLVVGYVIQMTLLFDFAVKKGFKYRFRLDFKDHYIRKLLILAVPVFLGNSISQVNQIVDKTLASSVAIGGITALNYAHKIDTLVHSIFITSVTTILYPEISMLIKQNNIDKYKSKIIQAINSTNFFIFPAVLGTMFLAKPIVSIIFAHGKFNQEALVMTSNALVFYMPGLIGISSRKVIIRAFYSLEDSKTPMINAMITLIINIILNVVFSKLWGIQGIALATTTASIISMFLMYVQLRKKIGRFGIRKLVKDTFKIILSAIIMIGVLILTQKLLVFDLYNIMTLLLVIIFCAIFYLIISWILRISVVDSLVI